jgi:hypothetical protein
MTTASPDEGRSLTDEELAAFTEAAPDCEHSPLWTHLDWSLWGTGLGDTFREPLASTMVAAIPPRVRSHAEMVMAEFLKWRGAESPVLTNADLRAEVKQLRAENAALNDELHMHRLSHAVAVGDAYNEHTKQQAAEVDRLRAENTELHVLHDGCDAHIEQLRRYGDEYRRDRVAWKTERDALTAALDKVATALDQIGGRIYRDIHTEATDVTEHVEDWVAKVLRDFTAYAEEHLAVLNDPSVRAALETTPALGGGDQDGSKA